MNPFWRVSMKSLNTWLLTIFCCTDFEGDFNFWVIESWRNVPPPENVFPWSILGSEEVRGLLKSLKKIQKFPSPALIFMEERIAFGDDVFCIWGVSGNNSGENHQHSLRITGNPAIYRGGWILDVFLYSRGRFGSPVPTRHLRSRLILQAILKKGP